MFSDLTVAENMRLAARHAPPDPARLDWIFGFFPALKKFWQFPAGVLSGGQKQMLSIARAVIEPRSLILVDEPTKGIAPAIIENMIHAFQELKRSNTTILLVEQNFRFAAALGDTRRGDGRRPDRSHRHDGRARRRRRAADAPARPLARRASIGISR